MTFSIPLAALVALSATAQAPEAASKSAAVVPFVGDEVAAVAHVNLARWDVGASRKVLGNLADDAEIAGAAATLDRWVEGLKKAGVSDVYVLVDVTDMPGYPLVVLPVPPGVDGPALAAKLSGEPALPLRWAKVEVVRGAVVASTPAILERLKSAPPSRRADVAPALAGGADSPISIAVIPSLTQRRSLEEAMPSLPPTLGGAPISALTRGLDWASITLKIEPSPTVLVFAKGRDADASKALQKVSQDGLAFLAGAARGNPAVASLADPIAAMKPEAGDGGVSLEADLDKTAALVAVPVRQVREATRRSQCVNNMKQIGLAMHNYHSVHNAFPPAYTTSKDGKPLLSWRVLILPFLEQESLYKQFRLDEPWDGPHNRPLIARMPGTYACPSGSKAVATEWKTSYLAPRGPATMFPGAEGVKIKDVTDGTSNTILVVEAGDQASVPWTRPDDWDITPDFRAQALWGHHPRGTNFGFADGSVRFLKESITPAVLKALLTRNGGEVLSSDDF